MREFHFYGTWDDSLAVFGAILGTGKATAFTDGPHVEPKVQFFDTLTPELEESARTQRGFFLWLPGISDSVPIDFGRWDSGVYAGRYFVSSRGPYLDLLLPLCREEGGLIRLGAGCLSCAHEFYVPDPGIVVKMPRAAQEIDGEFRRIIKAYCKRFGPKKQWVGHHASKLLEEGKAEVTGFGFYE